MMSCTRSGTRNRIDSPRARSDRTRVAEMSRVGTSRTKRTNPAGAVRIASGSSHRRARRDVRNCPVARKRGGAGAFGDDHVGERRDAFEVDPGVESRQCVHSQDQTQGRVREFLAHGPQRCRGHRRSGARELAPVRLEPRDIRNRRFEHAHAHVRVRRGRAPQPRTGCGHQAHGVETQGGAQLQGEPEVRAVHRVERPAEDPDGFEGCGSAARHGVRGSLERGARAACHARRGCRGRAECVWRLRVSISRVPVRCRARCTSAS